MSKRDIYVYFDHQSEKEPVPLGILSTQTLRGKELFSFAFDDAFLTRPDIQLLDPDLQFYAGPQFTDRANFGLFMDSAPDRWGRKLMQRREALRAKQAGEKPRTLLESDYLLGVFDETRMGALRFKSSPDGDFQNSDLVTTVPPWTRLRELEEACRHLEREETATEHEKWLTMLIAPGSSLGGARPKANVADPAGNLWIAKFPSHRDESNVSAWEYAAMLMARDAGLNVPECRVEKISQAGATFLVKRFDRIGTRRIHFASAMTLLGKTDGASEETGCGYLELAQFITRYGAEPQKDLAELWRRIVFSIAISNTDDHLRNHGFLLARQGWRLSPAYDLNPNADGTGLSLNISDIDNALDFDLALEVAPMFRLSSGDAEKMLVRIRKVVSQFRNYAGRDISRAELERMSPAFRY